MEDIVDQRRAIRDTVLHPLKQPKIFANSRTIMRSIHLKKFLFSQQQIICLIQKKVELPDGIHATLVHILNNGEERSVIRN